MRRRRDTPRTDGGARRAGARAGGGGAGAQVPAAARLVSGGLPRRQRGRHARCRAGEVRVRPALARAGRGGQPDRVRYRRAARRDPAAAGPAGHRRGAGHRRAPLAGGGRRANHGESVPVHPGHTDPRRAAPDAGDRHRLCRLVDAGRAGGDAALAAGRRGRGLPGPGRAGGHAGAHRFWLRWRAHGGLLAGRRGPGDRRIGTGQPAEPGPPAVLAGCDGTRGCRRDTGRVARRGCGVGVALLE